MEPRVLCYGSIPAVREAFLEPLWRWAKEEGGEKERWISRSETGTNPFVTVLFAARVFLTGF